jgi:hypothetical protein
LSALERYRAVHTREHAIYYIDPSGALAKNMVQVIYGDIFGEWKKANNVPEEVMLLSMTSEDNAFTETLGEVVQHTLATVRNYHLDLSDEFLLYLSTAANEWAVVSSLVKSIIGDSPAASDTAVFLTVNGIPLKTDKNDFSFRMTFDIRS